MSDTRDGFRRLQEEYGYIATDAAPMRGLILVHKMEEIERSFLYYPDTADTHHQRKVSVLNMLRDEEMKGYARRK